MNLKEILNPKQQKFKEMPHLIPRSTCGKPLWKNMRSTYFSLFLHSFTLLLSFFFFFKCQPSNSVFIFYSHPPFPGSLNV